MFEQMAVRGTGIWKMKGALSLLAISLSLLAGCKWKRTSLSTPVVSPSGKYRAAAEVNLERDDKAYYRCLKLHLSNITSGQTTVTQTSASEKQIWALGWMPDKDIVVLYSADIGTRAYRPGTKGIFTSIKVTDEVVHRAEQLKQEKYGK